MKSGYPYCSINGNGQQWLYAELLGEGYGDGRVWKVANRIVVNWCNYGAGFGNGRSSFGLYGQGWSGEVNDRWRML